MSKKGKQDALRVAHALRERFRERGVAFTAGEASSGARRIGRSEESSEVKAAPPARGVTLGRRQ